MTQTLTPPAETDADKDAEVAQLRREVARQGRELALLRKQLRETVDGLVEVGKRTGVKQYDLLHGYLTGLREEVRGEREPEARQMFWEGR